MSHKLTSQVVQAVHRYQAIPKCVSLLYTQRKCEIAHTVRVCVGDENGINVAEAVFREPLYCSRQEALPDINHDYLRLMTSL